jgi:hypothetical protein
MIYPNQETLLSCCWYGTSSLVALASGIFNLKEAKASIRAVQCRIFTSTNQEPGAHHISLNRETLVNQSTLAMKPLLFLLLAICIPLSVEGFSVIPAHQHHGRQTVLLATKERAENEPCRRQVLAAILSASILSVSSPANANRYILDEETGDYVGIEEADWQTTWKERMDKAQSMSTEEIVKAARGAGNLERKEGPESDVSKKRRAMAGCRDLDLRKQAGAADEKECTARVLRGDIHFMLNVL